LGKGEMKVMSGHLLNGLEGLGYSLIRHRVSPLGYAVITWASGCCTTCWPVFISTTSSNLEGVKVEDLLDKGLWFLCCLSFQVGEGDPELGAYGLSPVPSVWAPSHYELPPDSHLLERPVCVAVFMPTAPMRRSGVSRPPGGKKGRRALVVALCALPFLLEGVHFSLDAEWGRITLACF
jgi:hypothetical protein